jgi:uncharacterized OB-fold protein
MSATPATDKPARSAKAPAGPRKIPAPRVLPESQPYWTAADEGRLMVKKCRACGELHHYPRDICPFCLSADTEWLQATGTGTVYSFSTMGKGETAYTLAFVTLDEGVTLMTNLVDCDPGRLAIGQKVRVSFKPSEGGHAVPMFTPV